MVAEAELDTSGTVFEEIRLSISDEKVFGHAERASGDRGGYGSNPSVLQPSLRSVMLRTSALVFGGGGRVWVPKVLDWEAIVSTGCIYWKPRSVNGRSPLWWYCRTKRYDTEFREIWLCDTQACEEKRW